MNVEQFVWDHTLEKVDPSHGDAIDDIFFKLVRFEIQCRKSF